MNSMLSMISLFIIIVGCGSEKKSNSSDQARKQPQTTQRSENQRFTLEGLPEQALPYATCGIEGKAYDRHFQ